MKHGYSPQGGRVFSREIMVAIFGDRQLRMAGRLAAGFIHEGPSGSFAFEKNTHTHTLIQASNGWKRMVEFWTR